MKVSRGFSREPVLRGPIVVLLGALCVSLGAATALQQPPPAGTFRIEVVAPGLETPWGMAFLPDGRLLVTERPGRLRIIEKDRDKGKLVPDPVQGTPKVWERQDAGMLDVAIHPQYARNGWIYLAYAEVVPGYVAPPPAPPSPPSMTVFVRGKVDKKNRWVGEQVIYRAPPELYTPSGSHYGTRFLFDKTGHVFFSLGERGDMTNAQDLSKPLGKIHRVNDDGSIPKDNPFVNTPNALPSIWTYGHRNPQGLAWDSAGLRSAASAPSRQDPMDCSICCCRIQPGRAPQWGCRPQRLERSFDWCRPARSSRRQASTFS